MRTRFNRRSRKPFFWTSDAERCPTVRFSSRAVSDTRVATLKLGQLLQAKGFHLDKRRPRFGDQLPETMDGHAGSIIFGGPMSANDSDDFIKREIDWIGVPLAEGAPFLGICLGAQMMVKKLGGTVEPHNEGCAEIGFYPLQATDEGRALGDWPEMVYQWHREGFELPSGSTLLACGDIFRNQAFCHGPAAIGIQFHSELTYAMACRCALFQLAGRRRRSQRIGHGRRGTRECFGLR